MLTLQNKRNSISMLETSSETYKVLAFETLELSEEELYGARGLKNFMVVGKTEPKQKAEAKSKKRRKKKSNPAK